MKCTNCGFDLNDGMRFCPNCGSGIPTQTETTASEKTETNPVVTPQPVAQPTYAPAKKSNSNKLLPVIIVAIIILVAVIAFAILYNFTDIFTGGSSSSSNKDVAECRICDEEIDEDEDYCDECIEDYECKECGDVDEDNENNYCKKCSESVCKECEKFSKDELVNGYCEDCLCTYCEEQPGKEKYEFYCKDCYEDHYCEECGYMYDYYIGSDGICDDCESDYYYDYDDYYDYYDYDDYYYYY